MLRHGIAAIAEVVGDFRLGVHHALPLLPEPDEVHDPVPRRQMRSDQQQYIKPLDWNHCTNSCKVDHAWKVSLRDSRCVNRTAAASRRKGKISFKLMSPAA